MNDSSRIPLITAVETIPRQTQKRDFGEVIANGISAVMTQGANLVRGAVGAVPMLSAAVSGIQSVSGMVSNASLKTTVASPTNDLDATFRSLQGSGELTGKDYLALQHAMQQESQQYQTLTNILKVRSDSAKAAINNIR